MDCRTFRNDLEEYLQGGLDFAGRFGMERHAGQCYFCKRSVDEAEKLGRMSRQLSRVQAPANFEVELLARIHARESGRLRSLFERIRMGWDFRRGDISWRIVAAAGVPALALAAAVVVGRMAPPPAAVAPELADQRHATVQPAQEIPPPRTTPAETDATTPVIETAAAPIAAPSTDSRRRTFGADPAERPARSTVSRLATDRRPRLEPADSDYLEYRVPGERDFILRLPTTIRMRYAQPSEDHFIRNVSH